MWALGARCARQAKQGLGLAGRHSGRSHGTLPLRPALACQPARLPGHSKSSSVKVHAVKMEQTAARRRAVAGLQRARLKRRAAKQPAEFRQAAVGGGLEAPLVVADACGGKRWVDSVGSWVTRAGEEPGYLQGKRAMCGSSRVRQGRMGSAVVGAVLRSVPLGMQPPMNAATSASLQPNGCSPPLYTHPHR